MNNTKKQRLIEFYENGLTKEFNNYTNYYFSNNAKELRKVVDIVLSRYDVIDKEEYYSLATDIFVNEVLPNYDSTKSCFSTWLNRCLVKKFFSAITAENRQKRFPYLRDSDGNIVLDENGKPIKMKIIYVDAPILTDNREDGSTVGDMIASDFNLEKKVLGEPHPKKEKIEKYLNRLSKRQRKCLEMLAGGYKSVEIQEILHITGEEYSNCMKSIHAYENISILF